MRTSRLVRLFTKEVEEAMAEIFEGVEEEVAEVVETVKTQMRKIPFYAEFVRKAVLSPEMIIPMLAVRKMDNRRRKLGLEVVLAPVRGVVIK